MSKNMIAAVLLLTIGSVAQAADYGLSKLTGVQVLQSVAKFKGIKLTNAQIVKLSPSDLNYLKLCLGRSTYVALSKSSEKAVSNVLVNLSVLESTHCRCFSPKDVQTLMDSVKEIPKKYNTTAEMLNFMYKPKKTIENFPLRDVSGALVTPRNGAQ
jgi:hypothetical protein